MKAIYSFVIDGDAKFENQARAFLATLLSTGVEPQHIIAHTEPSTSPETKAAVSFFGVELVSITPFLDQKYCNKLLQIDTLLSRPADFYVLCDTDLVFLESIEPLFDATCVRAKPVDLPNPPLDQLELAKLLVGAMGEPRIVKTSCDEAETWSVNCNGGLYIIPSQFAAPLSAKWKFFAEKLCQIPDSLAGWYPHIDQIAFAMAMTDMRQDIRELPIEYNFPMHLTDRFDRFKFSEPKVLHYHWMQHEDGTIEATGHPVVDQAISKANALLLGADQAQEQPGLNGQGFDRLEEVTDFCRSERDRIAISDRDLFLLATNRVGLLVLDPKFSIPAVIDRVKHALRANLGFSLLRVGNGEGNAVSMTKPQLHKPTIDSFFAEFNSQNHLPIDPTTAISFCKEVKASLLDADMIGFRSFLGKEPQLIEQSIGDGNAYAALGISYAREFLCECLDAGVLSDRVVTSAWIHLDLLPYIDELLSLSDRVIVITGREELRPEFERRLGPRLEKFIAIPVQGHVPASIETSHFYAAFPKIKEELSRDLSGRLVIVGAGLFGKIYCATAKRSGAVAVDMGSAFDVLSGLSTRPVFSRYNFDGVAWI